MKTTIDIHDELLRQARQHARATGRSLRAVIEEGIRLVLSAPEPHGTYKLPDMSVGDPDAADPLAGVSWQELRETIYGEPESH